MTDFLDTLAKSARETINEGYYDKSIPSQRISISLKNSIIHSSRIPVITEIKGASPSEGSIRKNLDPATVAKEMEGGGAVGLSILTEPKHFHGSPDIFAQARAAVPLPILMKDIIIDPIQLEFGAKIGANVVLLIQALFDRGYCDYRLDEMIEFSNSKGLEVLLETHNENEFSRAVETKADLIGINNRDLRSLKVDLNVTKKILSLLSPKKKIVISESGIKTASDIVSLKENGASAFLVGSSIMKADNIERKVRELIEIEKEKCNLIK